MSASYSGLTARDVPEARQDLIDWAADRGGRLIAERGGGPLGRILAASARQAELYYVNTDMTALARQIGSGLDVYALAHDDLPAPHGFLVWDGPATGEPPGAAPTAVAWMATGTRLVVSLLGPAAAYRTWCAGHSRAALESAGAIAAGRLVYRGRGPVLPLDVPDAEWGSLGLGDHDEATRTLLATLLLIRQPVEARRSLHEVEEVAPSRASRRRILRAGGDPTRMVRMVTLRQSLRPQEADERSGEHAQRIYRHRWFVRMHRRTYPDHDHPEGNSKRWVGPYLVVPPGCGDAPILGGDRVNVLRR